MVCIWIARFKSNLSLNVYGGMEKCFTCELEEKEMCLYILSTSGTRSSKKSLTEALSWWGFKDRLIDWLIYLSFGKKLLSRWLTSVICYKCAKQRQLHAVYLNSYSSVFLSHHIWYSMQVLQVLSLLDSTEKVIIWATHVINQHLKDWNVKLFSAHRQQVLDIIFPWFMPLLCLYFAAKCGIALYMLMELPSPLVLQFHLYYPSPVSEQGNGAYYSPLDAHPIILQWRIHPPCV